MVGSTSVAFLIASILLSVITTYLVALTFSSSSWRPSVVMRYTLDRVSASSISLPGV